MTGKLRNAVRRIGLHFHMFARNGRWGTCGDCPRDTADNIYPEFCPNTKRYDHLLTLDELVARWNIETAPQEGEG